MTPQSRELVLWVGPKHSGKTTAATALAKRARAEGFRVAGVLSTAIYEAGTLTGFDVVDVATGLRVPLARRGERSRLQAGLFGFRPGGLELGRAALTSGAARSADLVLVDEFGPLELRGAGWRPAVDTLLPTAVGAVLLVVRERLADGVARLYGCHRPRALPARPGSVGRLLAMLRERKETR